MPKISELSVAEARELDTTLEIPAPFVNKFRMTLLKVGLLRVTYGETTADDGQVHLRGAFFVHVVDVPGLINALQQAVDANKTDETE